MKDFCVSRFYNEHFTKDNATKQQTSLHSYSFEVV